MRPLTRIVALALAVLLVAPKSAANQGCGAAPVQPDAPQEQGSHHHPAPGSGHHLPCQPGNCATMIGCHVAAVAEPAGVALVPAVHSAMVRPAAVLLPPMAAA